jgi:hypothetical protein
MTEITRAAPRTVIVEEPEELHLTILRKRWSAAGLISTILLVVGFFGPALWALVFEVRLIQAGNANPGDVYWGLPMFSLGCVGAFCFHLYFLTKRTTGREEVEVKGGRLILRREVFGSSSSRTFDLSQVCNPRVCRTLQDWYIPRSLTDLREGRMAFNYAGEKVRFGGDLGQKEAKPLVAAIFRRLGAPSPGLIVPPQHL